MFKQNPTLPHRILFKYFFGFWTRHWILQFLLVAPISVSYPFRQEVRWVVGRAIPCFCLPGLLTASDLSRYPFRAGSTLAELAESRHWPSVRPKNQSKPSKGWLTRNLSWCHNVVAAVSVPDFLPFFHFSCVGSGVRCLSHNPSLFPSCAFYCFFPVLFPGFVPLILLSYSDSFSSSDVFVMLLCLKSSFIFFKF